VSGAFSVSGGRKMLKKLFRRFFDYEITETWLVDTGKGYKETRHIRKWYLKGFKKKK
jgi:hypothetical protein